jgi:hypothetical protein
MNVSGKDDKGNVFMGGYDGFIYKPNQASTYADASESAPGTITSYWQSGWLNPKTMNEIIQVRKATLVARPKASGSITFSYGFDGISASASPTLSQVATSTEVYVQRSTMLTGRGNTFQFKAQLASSTIDMEIHKILLNGKVYGQKGQDND